MKMASMRRQQSGHWAGEAVDANTLRFELSTPVVKPAFFFGDLNRPVVSLS